jgi:hypothetical protein
MVKIIPFFLLLTFGGCVLSHGNASLNIVCNRTIQQDHLRDMEHAKCDKKLPLSFTFKF